MDEQLHFLSCRATMMAMTRLRAELALYWMESSPLPEKVEIPCLPGRRLIYIQMDVSKWGLAYTPDWLWFSPDNPMSRVGMDQLMGRFIMGASLTSAFS